MKGSSVAVPRHEILLRVFTMDEGGIGTSNGELLVLLLAAAPRKRRAGIGTERFTLKDVVPERLR